MLQTSINLSVKRNSFYDSTDSDSSSSDDDDNDVGEDTKPKKGRLLKQSFLAKKVYGIPSSSYYSKTSFFFQ